MCPSPGEKAHPGQGALDTKPTDNVIYQYLYTLCSNTIILLHIFLTEQQNPVRPSVRRPPLFTPCGYPIVCVYCRRRGCWRRRRCSAPPVPSSRRSSCPSAGCTPSCRGTTVAAAASCVAWTLPPGVCVCACVCVGVCLCVFVCIDVRVPRGRLC